MAKINCNGDCLNCEHRINGETQTSECASMFGFIHTQIAVKEIRGMHTDIKAMHDNMMMAIQNISVVGTTETVIAEPNEFECESPLLLSTAPKITTS